MQPAIWTWAILILTLAFDVRVGTLVTLTLGNVHANFDFLMACFQVKSLHEMDKTNIAAF